MKLRIFQPGCKALAEYLMSYLDCEYRVLTPDGYKKWNPSWEWAALRQ